MDSPGRYGLWPSPLTPARLAQGRRLESARVSRDGKRVVWLESRGGHGVLVSQPCDMSDAPSEWTSQHSVRAGAGYGGGDFTVGCETVLYVEQRSGRLYRQDPQGDPVPLTPQFGKVASPTLSPDEKWVLYVHQDEGVDRIAVVDSQGERWPQIVAEGRDFYMQPRWSPDGKQITWVAWDHPNMPWDGTWLESAAVDAEGEHLRIESSRVIAGGDETAIGQPEFTCDGQLCFLSDQTGWNRLAICDADGSRLRWLTPDGVNYGGPAWLQDQRSYWVTDDGREILAVRDSGGFQGLERIQIDSGEIANVESACSYTSITQIHGGGEQCVLVGSAPCTPPRLLAVDLRRETTRVVARACAETLEPSTLVASKPIEWATADEETAHGHFYDPAADGGESGEKPPLVVLIHGGPTSHVRAGWHPDAQFLASRGYAVLCVNYRGSTGYGRAYMLRLRGNWGVCDVEDAISGARFLASEGAVDPRRLAIMGGSAGGFTVLQAMTQHPDVFTAGVCLYGVADQFRLAAGTHKFESRYLDTLLGPLPQASELYRARSPLLHCDRIQRPLAVFQGDIDAVVPREQSDLIVESLKRRGTPHIYHVYEGEGHGWRQPQTIEHYYQALNDFLRQYLVFA